LFGRGERRREPEVERVRIDETLDAYRHAKWDAYGLLTSDLQAASLEANAAGQHLWDSTERLQAYSVATWMAATRQSIGNTLLSTAESASPEDNIPTDVASSALTNYQEAEKWLRFREDVNGNPYYEQSGGIDARITWPKPDVQTLVSPELMAALKVILGQLTYVERPVISSIINNAYMKHFFKYYKQRLTQEGAHIESRTTSLDQRWDDKRLNPNIEPGKTTYNELVELIEDLLAHGIHELMPITQDARYLAAVRRNRPQSASTEPEFSFDPGTLKLEHSRHQPSGKPFVPHGLLPAHPLRPERQEKPFTAPILEDKPSTAQTPTAKPFDPTLFRSPAQNPAGANPKRAFDPTALFNHTTGSQSPQEKPFDPETLDRSD